MKQVRSLIVIGVILLCSVLFTLNTHAETSTQKTDNKQPVVQQKDTTQANTRIYTAQIIDASEVKNFTYTSLANTQLVTVELLSGSVKGKKIDTQLIFPNPQFKKPLKKGDKVVVEGPVRIDDNAKVSLLSLYKQNNILVWGFMLLGLFILVSGFRSNAKYLQILFITFISGFIVIYFYHRNTYIAIGGLILWQVLATYIFSYQIFKNKIPSIILTGSVFVNQLIAIALIFIMANINLIDSGLFDLFISSPYDAREVLIYILAILVVYPMTIVFAEQLISESIKKKREDNSILKINLIKYLTVTSLKLLNTVFLSLFGLFFAIFAAVISFASKTSISTNVINSSSMSQLLAIGFLILFDLLIFIPLVSFVSGMWLGRLESHELVTDQNLRQLDFKEL